MSDENSSFNMAGAGAVIAVLALVLSFYNLSQTGTLAEISAGDKEVGAGNDVAIMGRIDALDARVKALESAPAPAPAPAAPAAPAAEGGE